MRNPSQRKSARVEFMPVASMSVASLHKEQMRTLRASRRNSDVSSAIGAAEIEQRYQQRCTSGLGELLAGYSQERTQEGSDSTGIGSVESPIGVLRQSSSCHRSFPLSSAASSQRSASNDSQRCGCLFDFRWPPLSFRCAA